MPGGPEPGGLPLGCGPTQHPAAATASCTWLSRRERLCPLLSAPYLHAFLLFWEPPCPEDIRTCAAAANAAAAAFAAVCALQTRLLLSA